MTHKSGHCTITYKGLLMSADLLFTENAGVQARFWPTYGTRRGTCAGR